VSNSTGTKNPKISYQKGTILDKRILSQKVTLFKIKPEVVFEWVPGQFIITKNMISGEERVADYSILSSPTVINEFEIAVENYEGSRVGKYLHSLKPGDNFIFKAPRGGFLLEKNPNSSIFVFRNIGIAAIIPLLNQLYEKNSKEKFIVFNFNSSDFTEIFKTRFDKFRERLDLTYNLIDINVLDSQVINNGKLNKNQMRTLFSEYTDFKLYIAGASEFVKNFRQKAISFGFDKNNIVREFFG